MSVINFLPQCQKSTNKALFGLCDDLPPPHKPAYLDEKDGAEWIGVVVNDYNYEATFTAIDHCIEMKSGDGKQSSQCDGMLTYNNSLVFVELKRDGSKKNKEWIKKGTDQLKITIDFFKENKFDFDDYNNKRAYLANKEFPKFKYGQTNRMDKFQNETGFILRIEQRIILQ